MKLSDMHIQFERVHVHEYSMIRHPRGYYLEHITQMAFQKFCEQFSPASPNSGVNWIASSMANPTVQASHSGEIIPVHALIFIEPISVITEARFTVEPLSIYASARVPHWQSMRGEILLPRFNWQITHWSEIEARN